MGRWARLGRSLALAGVLLPGCAEDPGPEADAAVCGTHGAPGILTLANLSPAPRASVPNRNIVHSFTVVNAPADFYDFDMIYGDDHTAGLSTPEDPRFHTTVSGNAVNYQLLIDAWSNAPARVVLSARSGFDTSKGCAWVFPSPLFDYDITAMPTPDGGAAPDSRPGVDGLGWPIGPSAGDATSGGSVDVASALEVLSETAPPVDATVVDAVDAASPGLDGPAVDLDANVNGDG